MKRIGLVAIAIVASALVAPAARAASVPDVVHGGCFFRTSPDPSATTEIGVIGDASLTTTGDNAQAPLGATVTCWIEVNGVVAPGTTHSYGDGTAPTQAGADPVSFAATDVDSVFECQSATFADGTEQTDCPIGSNGQGFGCFSGGGQLNIPPQTLEDLFVVLIERADECVFAADVDPVVCPVLRDLAGNYVAATIAPDGDVSVLDPLGLFGGAVYDCPPYINP